MFINININNTTRVALSLILSFLLISGIVVEGYALSKFEKDSEETTLSEKEEGERLKDSETRYLDSLKKMDGGDKNPDKFSRFFKVSVPPIPLYIFKLFSIASYTGYPHIDWTKDRFSTIKTRETGPVNPFHILYHRLVFYDSIA